MPPKMKQSRTHRCEGKSCSACTNPRVVLRPLGEPLLQTCYRFSTTPPVASLFKRSEFSDIKLQVGDDQYYAHRLVLCAASEVFAKMLGSNWQEKKKDVLALEEEDECVKVFDRFLKYLYSGSTVISESYVIPLFMLADKYYVPQLYEECVKVIENGLKVYTAPVKNCHLVFSLPPGSPESSSSGSESSESEYTNPCEGQNLISDESQPSVSGTGNRGSKTHLVASETFPLSMVIKLLSYCNNQRIADAALYNLETRLSAQLYHENYIVWNELDKNLIVNMLKDDNFYCDEFVLFKGAKAWLEYDELRQSTACKAEVLSTIRYPVMKPCNLYEVENDELVQECKEAKDLVHQALRYKLFCQFSRPKDQEKWKGSLFKGREPKKQ